MEVRIASKKITTIILHRINGCGVYTREKECRTYFVTECPLLGPKWETIRRKFVEYVIHREFLH
jgi:hypothetical protein